MKRIRLFLTLLLAFVVQISFAQEKEIKGTVSDETGPLPGVNVIIKGTSKGTQTDFDGKFTLKKVKKGDVIQFSYVGMTTVEKKVGSKAVMNVKMKQNAQALEEVVIMGYGARKKNELTGSTVQLKSEDISEAPVASVDQALQGKVAGLTISGSSGTPGSTQDIRIRGISSVTASNDPLYVIDGVPVVGGNISGSDSSSSLTALSSLNPEDIESMTVLKDASATSAYGARGANGVIVITTKSGKSGKTKFSFSSSVGFSNDAVKGRRPLTAQEIIDLGYEALVNSGKFKTVEEARSKYDWPLKKWGFKEGVDKGADWEKEITNKDALQQTYNLSAKGGKDDYKFYASLGYLKQDAAVIGADFNRITGSFNFSKKLTDKLKLTTNSSVSSTKQNGILEASAYFASPRTAKYFISPMAGSPYNEDGTINTNLNTNVFNPLYIIKHNITEARFRRFMNNSSLKYDFTDNLEFKTTVSFDYINRDRKSYRNRYYGDGKDTNGNGYVANYQNVNMVWQNALDYHWYITDDHKLDLKGLVEYQENKSKYLSAEGIEFSTDGLTNLDTAGKPKSIGSSAYDWYSASYMAMANYGFKSKFFIDLTYRYEGSSKFPKDKRFGNFWAVGAAWNVHKESFMESLHDVVSNLKLRASYGLNGNSGIDLNTYQAFFAYDADYADSGAAYPDTFGNADLTWEKNALLDVGFDLGLFNDRITTTFSYFSRRTYDLLLEVPLSLTTGHDKQNRNVGEMSNKGIEVELNADIVKSDDFNFSIGGNVATVKNEVTKLAKDSKGETIEITTGTRKVVEGEAVYSWYMRKYAGVNPENGNAQWYKNGVDGEVTEVYKEAKRAFVGGSALPTLTGGVNAHLDYKGFFLDANVYFAMGHKVSEDWASYTHQGGLYNLTLFNGVEDLLKRWQKPGDVTDVPKVMWNYDQDRSSTSTRFLYDGDYMRLKDLTVGYVVPSEFLKNTFFNGVKIYAKGSNLLTWVKDDRLKNDPETGILGFIGLTTPPAKTFLFGVNLNF